MQKRKPPRKKSYSLKHHLQISTLVFSADAEIRFKAYSSGTNLTLDIYPSLEGCHCASSIQVIFFKFIRSDLMSDGRLRADARYSRDTTPASTESTPGPFLRKLELFLRATMVALLTLVAGGFILAALEWTGLWLISDGSEKEDRSLVSAAKEKPEIDRSALAAAVFKKGQHSGRFNDLDFANAANIAVYNDIVAWAKSPRYIKELTAAILLSVELIHRGNPRGTDTDFISNYGIASAYCMVLTLQTDPELAREGLFGVSDRCFAQLNVFDH